MKIDARNRQIRKQNTKVGCRATLTTEGSYLSLGHNETKLRHFSLLLLYVPLCKRQSFEALIDLAFETLALFLAVECLYLLLPYEIRRAFSAPRPRLAISNVQPRWIIVKRSRSFASISSTICYRKRRSLLIIPTLIATDNNEFFCNAQIFLNILYTL